MNTVLHFSANGAICETRACNGSDGDLDGLSWQQLDLLTRRHNTLTKRDARV